jgi:hypothetical protein
MQILVSPNCAFRHKLAKILKELEKEISLLLDKEKVDEAKNIASWSLL